MRARTLWIVAALALLLGIVSEICLSGWQDVRIRLEGFVFLLLLLSPILIPAALIGLPLCGLAGWGIADQKMREPAEGLLLGLLLGPLGVLIEATLPDQGRQARDHELRE